jgi:hypothetical protein
MTAASGTPRKTAKTTEQALAEMTATVDAMKREQAKIKADVAAAARLVADAETMRVQTFKMVHDMHQALMEPQMGHGDKPLLQRMAEVTVEIESGKRSADAVLYAARWLVAVGAIIAGLIAFAQFGHIGKD